MIKIKGNNGKLKKKTRKNAFFKNTDNIINILKSKKKT